MEKVTRIPISLIVEGDASENMRIRVIGLESENKLEEISIITISKKGIARETDPYKTGRRLARSPIRRERKGQESEMEKQN